MGDARADAADVAGEMEHVVDGIVGEVLAGGGLVAQVELARGGCRYVLVPFLPQPFDQRPADHPAAARNEGARLLLHAGVGLSNRCRGGQRT